MIRWSQLRMAPGSLVLAILCAGCLNLKPKPDPTRYYVLSAPVPSQDPAGNLPWTGPRIYVDRVETPEYLDPREMATRRDDREVVYSALHQWAEPLRDGMTRVLRDVLTHRLGPGSITAGQVRRPAGTFLEVQASVSRFEWTTDRQAILQARWEITEQPSRKRITGGQSSVAQAVDPGQLDYGGGVSALSRCLEVWGAELATVLKSCEGTGSEPAAPAKN